jgi:hypothetical protein
VLAVSFVLKISFGLLLLFLTNLLPKVQKDYSHQRLLGGLSLSRLELNPFP